MVSGIVLMSTVGVKILRERTASMHADGIDVRKSEIYGRWDLATFVCSNYFILAEISGYENNENVTLNLNPGWNP